MMMLGAYPLPRVARLLHDSRTGSDVDFMTRDQNNEIGDLLLPFRTGR